MRILVDYRPALRVRTGVGEYLHQLVRAYAATSDDEVVAFTSSWKDRPEAALATDLGVRIVDRRVPVRLLNYLWHRWEWPPVERLACDADVAHSPHPLLLPSRAAAQVVTIHDLFFLDHSAWTQGEIRRDYADLATMHARRADAIVTSTAYGKCQVVDRLGVDRDAVFVCPAGAPAWTHLGREPHLPRDGYVLFFGTLEPRKNIGTLLDAYTKLLQRSSPPRLVLAGRTTAVSAEWIARITRPPLQGHVMHLGYVPDEEREVLYAGARLVVMPSLDEGFGLPMLEAMAAGIPVVASTRGSLPEVVGDAGALIDPLDASALADAIERGVRDRQWAQRAAEIGLARAAGFRWIDAAAVLRQAYLAAIERRRRHG